MKTLWLIVAVASVLISGCGDDSKTANVVKQVDNTVSAPVNYVGAAVLAEKYSQKQIDLAFVNQAIQQFQAGEGRLPKSLQEMVELHYLAKIPEAPYGFKIVYDATTGSIQVLKQ